MKKIALVTGAGSGVGRQAALALADEGYSVVLAGRRRQALEETAALAHDQVEVLVAPADVADPVSVHDLFDKTWRRFERLDVVFNNAGIGAEPKPLEELSLEQWKSVVDINLTGVFLCMQAAFRLMRKQTPMGGRIINNGSVSSQVVRPNATPYNATKHGVTGLTKSASLEGRKYNIACGQIDIGNALTDMSRLTKKGALQADGGVRTEPHMAADDVARAVVYMASLPLEANVQWITVMATQMPLIGRG